MKPLRLLFALSALPLFGCLWGCGETLMETPALPLDCQPGWALILVSEGTLQNYCGCQEPSAPISEGTFTCTITAGTAVLFQLTAAVGHHQILSTGSPAFVSSPILSMALAENEEPRFTHVVRLETTGIYEFVDTRLPRVLGRLIVQ